jgi:glycosyltransferase involved in cell wall biosynthesis
VKALLIAYEFPPILAAQSLRWYYLANELAEQGVDIEVLCPDMPAARAFQAQFHPGIVVHRTWPGPFVGFSQKLASKTTGGQGVTSAQEAAGARSLSLRAYQALRKLLDAVLYPDVRTEWYPYARQQLRRLIDSGGFDVVISSHEPGVDLLLGLWAKKRYGLPWLVDLADPLLAPYSPSWRRWLDKRVERRVLANADGVLVTTPKLIDLLARRHGEDLRTRCHVVAQGFPDVQISEVSVGERQSTLEIVYTGTFYHRFRNPAPFAEALRRIKRDDIRLTVVGDNAAFEHLFTGIGNVRFLGKADHFACLSMQRQASVLLNIGNSQDFQIPGKVYEYLGAGPPILHIRANASDQGATLVEATGAGLVADNNVESIAAAVEQLYQAWRSGTLAHVANRREDMIDQHSWRQRAKACLAAIEQIAAS